MKIGLYFGSFNPIHIGHLVIANHILNSSGLDKIWLVVSPRNPLKAGNSLLNEYDRLHLVQVAIEDDARLKASDVEFSLPKPSYTSVTLAHLTEKYPEHEFVIIMGSDSLLNLGKWKNAEYISSNFPIFVYPRPGFPVDKVQQPNITIMDAPLLELSATGIRNIIRSGGSVRYMLPDKVREEIDRSGYFR